MIYNVPNECIDSLRNCTNSLGRFVQLKYNKLIKTDSKLKEWVDSTKLSPILLHRLTIKANKTSFEYPILCPVCGKPLSERQILDGQKFCSRQCTFKSPETKSKIKETLIETYGVEHPIQNKDIMAKLEKTKEAKYGDKHFTNTEKRKETNLEKYGNKFAIASESVKSKIKETMTTRYGVENPFYSSEIRKKIQNSCKDKYGVATPLESKEIREKIEKTNLEKYGVENPLGNKEIREKAKNTNLTKYGVENPTQNKDIQAKIEATCQERYGAKSPLESKEIVAKITETNLKRYGVENALLSPIVRKSTQLKHRDEYWGIFTRLLGEKKLTPLFTKDEYVNDIGRKFKCGYCNTEFESEDMVVQHIYCPTCYVAPYSKKEKDVVSFIRSFYDGEIIENDRSILDGKEIDIYIPDKKVGIEFNGNYWHSLEFKPSGYHQKKSLECQKKGIRLLHIFEWEWDIKRDKIESLIKSTLGVFDRVIYARDTKFKTISNKEYSEFLFEYHLQGAVNSEYRFALFYKDEIVAVIGIGKSRFNDKEMELHRFCVKSGFRIIGGFSKLLKNALKCVTINRLISYVDIGHFDGSGYKAIGFKEIGLTTPNYVYVNDKGVLSRYQCQKHRLPQLLGKCFIPEMTEWENMYYNGYSRIEDCGNYKFEYER